MPHLPPNVLYGNRAEELASMAGKLVDIVGPIDMDSAHELSTLSRWEKHFTSKGDPWVVALGKDGSLFLWKLEAGS